MADITVTEASVKAANSNTAKTTGTAGAAVPIGRSVYADPTSGKIYKAQATNNVHTANLVGVSLTEAKGDGQPIVYATEGDVTFGTDLTVGQTYVVSPGTAGNIAPVSDLATGNFVGLLGVATTTSNLKLNPIPTSTAKP
jgi:hypothetical protein